MASTTLITFILSSVHGTATVDIFGSWDNFSRPYPMVKDSQKGHGSWYGCHLFTNIICDGDPANCCTPRNGALSMGGTYWYYYRRNGNDEFHNPNEPSTSQCPLLPGQTVNVLTVADCHLPKHLRGDQVDHELDAHMTMDPEHRFRRLATIPVRSRRDQVTTAVQKKRSMNHRFDHSLARLQSSIADTIISAYLQDRPTDELIKPRRAAASKRASTAPGRPSRVFDGSSHIRQHSSSHLRQSKLPPPSSAPRQPKGFFGDAASQPTGPAKEFANPFSLASFPEANVAEALLTAGTVKASGSDQDLRRPSTYPRVEFSRQNKTRIRQTSLNGVQYYRPQSGPSAFAQSYLPRPSSPHKVSGSLISTQATESAELPFHDSFKQVGHSDINLEPLSHPHTSQVDKAAEQDEPDHAAPTITSNPPPTRSKSQKLKRFASLKGRFKLPPMSQLPQIPKMKARKQSIRQDVEEPLGKAAVFNEGTSTWTPAMTSSSGSSPVTMSPLLQSTPAKSSTQMYPTDLPSPVLSMKDEPPRLPVQCLFEEQPLPIRSEGHSKPKAQRFLRGSSLPTLFNEAAYTSSQETITQAPRRWYQKPAVKTSAVDKEDMTNPLITSTHILHSLKSTPQEITRAHEDCPRESFDEDIHREQIRQILRASLAHSNQSEADERRNSFIMHQQRQERTSALSSRDSDSDDDTFSLRYNHSSVSNISSFAKGAPQPLAFDVADFDESFDYLAAAIF